MLEEVIELFGKYYQTLDQDEDPDLHRNHGMEVQERLRQLNYMLVRVRECERIATLSMERVQSAIREHVERLHREGIDFSSVPAPSNTKLTKEEAEAALGAEREMKLMTEAFYYFAGRIRSITRHKSVPLPGLENFECEGVRNVRNKLLEHPEGSDSRVLVQSFGWGLERGPVLKAVRYGGQEDVFPDAGLFVNAEEFRVRLTQCLERVLDCQPK
jgi:hypothetical protein